MYRGIYDSIKREYDRKRQAAEEAADRRKQEVYGKNPEIERIDREICRLGISYSRMALEGEAASEQAAEELNKNIADLSRKRTVLLLELGYPENYLKPVYECPECNDTGVKTGGNVRCSCFRQQLIRHIYSYSNLSLTEVENFEKFNENLYSDQVDEAKYGIKVSPRENILRIKAICEKFVENFNQPGGNGLFFSGPPGTGKTFMSSCIAKSLMDRGVTVLYQTAPVLFDGINRYKANVFKEGEYDDYAYRNIFEVELLIIDDLGTETRTAARYSDLLNILNTRYMYNLKRPCRTIISTNIGPRQLFEFYTERVVSRINGTFDRLMFAGDDIRTFSGAVPHPPA